MESEAKYAFVGLVVIALVFLGAMFAYWYTRAGKEGTQTEYLIYFQEQSLAGLQVNSMVTMRGIRVGNVRSFKILPDESQGVEVRIAIDEGVPVRTTTTAVIDRNLLTGLASIDLKAQPGGEGPMLTDVPAPTDSAGYSGPHVIREGKVPFREIAESAEDILKKTAETLDEIKSILTPENRRHLTNILANTEKLTESVARETERFGTIPDQVERVAGEIGDMTRMLDAAVAEVTAQIERFTQSVRVSFNTTAESLRSSSEKVQSTAEGFDDPSAIIFGPNKRRFGPGEQGVLP